MGMPYAGVVSSYLGNRSRCVACPWRDSVLPAPGSPLGSVPLRPCDRKVSNLDWKPAARFGCAGFLSRSASVCARPGALKASKTPWDGGSIQGAQPLARLQVAPAPGEPCGRAKGSCLV